MPKGAIIDGRAVAAGVRDRVRARVAALVEEEGVVPGLATVLVGDDPASALYVRRKREACEEVGMASIHRGLAAEASADELRAVLDEEEAAFLFKS